MAIIKRRREYFTVDDVVDIRVDTEGGRVTAFRLNFRVFLDGKWRTAVRYDTDHGHLHRHRCWLPAERQVQPLEDRERPAKDYGPAMREAQADLRLHWRLYRARMEAVR